MSSSVKQTLVFVGVIHHCWCDWTNMTPLEMCGYVDVRSDASHLTRFSVDRMDGRVLLCEGCRWRAPQAAPRHLLHLLCSSSAVTGLWHSPPAAAAAPPQSLLWLFRYWPCYKRLVVIVIKLYLEENQPAEDRSACVTWVNHAGTTYTLVRDTDKNVIVSKILLLSLHLVCL